MKEFLDMFDSEISIYGNVNLINKFQIFIYIDDYEVIKFLFDVIIYVLKRFEVLYKLLFFYFSIFNVKNRFVFIFEFG